MTRREQTITRAWLMERCSMEEGGHLIWKKAFHCGAPAAWGKDENGKARTFSVRLAAYKLWNGEAPKAPMTARPECGIPGCLSKKCLQEVPHGGYTRGQRKPLVERAKVAESQRRSSGHPQEVVDRIKQLRAEGLTFRKIAALTGASEASVSDITTGRRRRDYTGGMSTMVAALMK